MSLDQEFFERASSLFLYFIYAYKDRNIVETKIKEKDILPRRAFRCLNSELNSGLITISEKQGFLPGLFRHDPPC